MAHTLSIPLPLGITGLTLLASAINTAGALHASLRNLACTEIGTSGSYRLSIAMEDAYRGQVVFHEDTIDDLADLTTANTYGIADINPESSENADVKTSTVAAGSGLTAAQTRAALGMTAANLDTQLAAIAAKTILITSGNVSVVSPVGPTGATITIYRGDDYKESDANSLPFVATGVPSLVGATVKLKSAALTAGPITGTVVDATHVYFEIPRAQTELMFDADFEVEATMATTGYVHTIADGKITMRGQL